MALELILTELQPFFSRSVFKPSILPMDIMKMCMWVFDGSRNNFDRITTFQT